MKENRLIEMSNKIDILGEAVNRMINDIEFIKTVAMGDHSVIKKLKEFPAIIEELKEEHGNDQGEDSENRMGEEKSFETPGE